MLFFLVEEENEKKILTIQIFSIKKSQKVLLYEKQNTFYLFGLVFPRYSINLIDLDIE